MSTCKRSSTFLDQKYGNNSFKLNTREYRMFSIRYIAWRIQRAHLAFCSGYTFVLVRESPLFDMILFRKYLRNL